MTPKKNLLATPSAGCFLPYSFTLSKKEVKTLQRDGRVQLLALSASAVFNNILPSAPSGLMH